MAIAGDKFGVLEVDRSSSMERSALSGLHEQSQLEQHLDKGHGNDEAHLTIIQASFTHNWSDATTQYLIAQSSGVAVGYIQFRNSDTEGTAWIDDIFVETKYRGMGIAQSLLFSAESKLKVRGAKKIKMYTLITNHNAQRAYDRSGYSVVPSEYVDFEKEV